jgi:SAM-dependent methyltransferase
MKLYRQTSTHLYPGFRYAGVLTSIHIQREFQRKFLQGLPGTKLLITGCAYGEEANHIVENVSRWTNVSAIDLAHVSAPVRRQPRLSELGSRLHCWQMDLLDIQTIAGYAHFDIAQCGFVYHDIRFEEKQRAMCQLARTIRPGGYMILSEIFCHGEHSGVSDSVRVYDSFLHEAAAALDKQKLTSTQFSELIGNGETPGLLRSRSEAAEGGRDYFESIDCTITRAHAVGLQIRHVWWNPANSDLAVLVFQRPATSPDHQMFQMETTHVV